jgi:hypothetical protein
MIPAVLLPFGWATFALTVLQAACVALPRADAPAWLRRLRGRAWALIAPASIVVVIVAINAASAVADGLTWLAFVAVPPLAALALGRAAHGASPRAAIPAAAALLAVAWAAKGSLSGDVAAALLTALSCVALGWLIGAVTPTLPLKAGIVLMAAIDAYLVFSNELQGPNATLIAAAPLPSLPQLQFVQLAGASVGYGDLFIAGVFGAVVAVEGRSQLRAAALTLVLATAFDLLFWVFDELPATVPVALALVISEVGSRRSRCAS